MSGHKLAFVIAGAQKSGTTTLDAIFRRHPQIQMASTKEIHFFDDEKRNWASPNYSALNEYFTNSDDRLRGEATPITLYWRPAIRRLQDYNPDVQIVLMLRNPVTRAFSNWRHEYFHGRETVSFPTAIRGGRDRVRFEGTNEGLHRYFAYIERGLYGEQLSYLTRYFPKRNIHCEIYEEFFQDRSAGLDRIARFLGIDCFPAAMPDIYLNQTCNFAYPSALCQEDIKYLFPLFRLDIPGVEEFLGRRLPSWQIHFQE